MARPPRDPEAALRAKEFLERHLRERVDLGDVAQAAGVSRDHVIRLFRRTWGMTPFQYLRRLRLQRAHDLMRADLGGAGADGDDDLSGDGEPLPLRRHAR